jgi:hypothetical protein
LAFNLDEEQRSQLVKRVVASFGASCRSAKTHATAPVTRRTGSRAFGWRTFALQKGRELPLPEVLCSRSDAGRTYSARRYSGMLDGIVVRLRKPIARLSRSSPSALRQSSVSFCVIFRSVCCDGMAPNPTSQTGPGSTSVSTHARRRCKVGRNVSGYRRRCCSSHCAASCTP